MDTIIYRVEHPATGKGPFQSLGSIAGQNLAAFCNNSCEHPNIYMDIGIRLTDAPWTAVCGTQSIKMLRHWFNDRKVVELLEREGFVIRAYTMDKDATIWYGESGTQVLFMDSEATDYIEYPITRLLTKKHKGLP